MGNGIDGDIEYGRCEDPLSADQRKVRRSLSAQAHLSLDVLTAKLFAQGRVLGKDPECEQTQFCVMGDPWRAIRML